MATSGLTCALRDNAKCQLWLSDLPDDLRGERLREVAADVLWRNFHAGDVVHYKQWLECVVAEGYRIGGNNPTATFLTQVARVESVERLGRRSGLYRLSAAARQWQKARSRSDPAEKRPCCQGLYE